MFEDHYNEVEGQCPPESAKEPDGVFLRLVCDPPHEKDLLSAFELNEGMTCDDRGVSFATRPYKLERMRESYPEKHGHKKIATLELEADWGVMRKGSTSRGKAGKHVNLWLFKNACRKNILSKFIIAEDEKQ